ARVSCGRVPAAHRAAPAASDRPIAAGKGDGACWARRCSARDRWIALRPPAPAQAQWATTPRRCRPRGAPPPCAWGRESRRKKPLVRPRRKEKGRTVRSSRKTNTFLPLARLVSSDVIGGAAQHPRPARADNRIRLSKPLDKP